MDNMTDMSNIPDDGSLPPELQDLIDEIKQAKSMKIEEIGKDVAKKRDLAVKGRKESGIETIWEEDECYYEGVDENNHSQWLKSPSNTGGISRTPVKTTTRCTSFFNITRQFVESAAARMGDILLPAGDWNFSVSATPVQDKPANGQEQTPLEPVDGQMVQPPVAVPNVAPVPPAATPSQSPVQPPEPVDPMRSLQLIANDKAEKAEKKIQDWLVECSYHTEVRKVVEDAAKVGTGILKGPFPHKSTQRKATGDQQGLELVSDITPASAHVDYWDFFPDPNCGEDIHQGTYCLERDRLTAHQLKNLKGVPGYLADQIDKVLNEGPNKKNIADGTIRSSEDFTKDDDKYEVWYFHGLISPSGLSSMNVKITDKEKEKDALPAIVTLVNETVIKADINPLESGEFPYDLMPWQRVCGSCWGIGIARQGRTPQDMLNAATRALMDNAALASGPMIVMRKNAVIPADGRWELTARKVWYATEQSDSRSVQDAFYAINIPMVQEELNAIIQLAYKNMEDATGITFLLQGQQGSAPDTVGGMELLHRNASAILRRLARVFDERVTESHIRRYYEYLLLHGPDDCKGDLKIQAIGSTALVEREIQAMESMALLQLSVNPVYGLDPEKAMTEVLKTKRFIPEKWQMDDEKKAKLAAQAPPPIPAIEVAKLRSADVAAQIASDEKIAQEGLHRDAERIKVDSDRDQLYTQTMTNKENTNAQFRLQELQIKRDLAMLDYSTKRNISLDQIKSELARESMRLRTQKELAGVARVENNNVVPQVAPTDMEPAGQADPGRAFEQ